MKMPEVRVCGQCAQPTGGMEWSCPVGGGCGLSLCGTCSEPDVHLCPDGSCPKWWGRGLTEGERKERMQEAAQESA